MLGCGGALTGDRELITMLPFAVCKCICGLKWGHFQIAAVPGLHHDIEINCCPIVREVSVARKLIRCSGGSTQVCLKRGEQLWFMLPALLLITSLHCGAEPMSL